MSEKSHQIEHAADRYRDELLATLQELDRRRGAVTDFKGQLASHKGAALLTAGGIALIIGSVVSASILRNRYQNARLRRERVRGFIRAWEHPKRLASQANDRPLPAELLRKFALVFGTVLVTTYAKRSARLLLTGRETGKAH